MNRKKTITKAFALTVVGFASMALTPVVMIFKAGEGAVSMIESTVKVTSNMLDEIDKIYDKNN